MDEITDVRRVELNVVAIRGWLEGVFPSLTIETGWIQDGDYYLFRVFRDVGKQSEIQFERTALEDWSPDEILGDLATQSVAELMTAATSHRWTYTGERRALPFESRLVECDGVRYWIARGPGIEVRVGVFGSEELLPGLRNIEPPLLPGSIFKRDLSNWLEDIRKWRGPSV